MNNQRNGSNGKNENSEIKQCGHGIKLTAPPNLPEEEEQNSIIFFLSPSGREGEGLFSYMVMFAFFKERVALHYYRSFCKLAEHNKNKQPRKADEHSEFKRTE